MTIICMIVYYGRKHDRTHHNTRPQPQQQIADLTG